MMAWSETLLERVGRPTLPRGTEVHPTTFAFPNAVGVTQVSPERKRWEPKPKTSRLPFGGFFPEPSPCSALPFLPSRAVPALLYPFRYLTAIALRRDTARATFAANR